MENRILKLTINLNSFLKKELDGEVLPIMLLMYFIFINLCILLLDKLVYKDGVS